MHNISRHVTVIGPTVSEGALTLAAVLGVACHLTIAALRADAVNEVADDALSAVENDDAAGIEGPVQPGRSSCLSALMIAAVLLFTWVGLRSF